MFNNRTKSIAVGVVALGALVAGCGGGDDAEHGNMPGMGQASTTATDAPGQANANQADITFAQQMIPHHQQALDMAKLVPSRSSDQQVKDLAAQIERAQDPEIKTMTTWLKEWSAPAPTTGMDHGNMGSGEMMGMMTDEEMKQLEQAKGAEFDRLWMQTMIKHHKGAIEMAQTELKQGSNEQAKALAREVIDAQQAEIDTMEKLLAQN